MAEILSRFKAQNAPLFGFGIIYMAEEQQATRALIHKKYIQLTQVDHKTSSLLLT